MLLFCLIHAFFTLFPKVSYATMPIRKFHLISVLRFPDVFLYKVIPWWNPRIPKVSDHSFQQAPMKVL